MQINDANLTGVGAGAASGASRAQTADSAGARGRAGGGVSKSLDAIELSSFAQSVSDLQQGSAAREARVAELRELYQSGRYQVDAKAIATRLVDEALGR